MRKSCQSNCSLHVAFDTQGDIHLLVAALVDIPKGEELTLPFDFLDIDRSTPAKLIASGINLCHCVCNCVKEKCVLRIAINQAADKDIKKTKKEDTKVVKPKKEECEQQIDIAKKTTQLKVDVKTISGPVEQTDVKKKSPGVKKQLSKPASNEEHDELNKSMVSV